MTFSFVKHLRASFEFKINLSWRRLKNEKDYIVKLVILLYIQLYFLWLLNIFFLSVLLLVSILGYLYHWYRASELEQNSIFDGRRGKNLQQCLYVSQSLSYSVWKVLKHSQA